MTMNRYRNYEFSRRQIARHVYLDCKRNSLSKVQSVDQRMASNAVSAFANCGRAVAHVRGSYVK
jgi:hypothetical protein